MSSFEKHPAEASDSWQTYLNRHSLDENHAEEDQFHRNLKHHHHKHNDDKESIAQLREEKEQAYLEQQTEVIKKEKAKARKKHKKRVKQLLQSPGIQASTHHGLMIDAGSTGSRLHVYEWEPRVLHNAKDVQAAVSGKKISFPGTESRWTDRLRPGLASFASLPDDEIRQGVAEYLSPLIEFAEAILREKKEDFETFPIFLAATAGMRTLDTKDRSRVLGAVRSLFADKTFCPFYFEQSYARVISGEEEAIFGWATTNFLMGNLVEDSTGAGEVANPDITYGALDVGGASAQISFYEPNEDIMSNLFKLHIGQAKHWNLYAHSFLYYGINEARNRFYAQLLENTNPTQRLVDGVYNPCQPGGITKDVRINIHIDSLGGETWTHDDAEAENGFYNAVLTNDKETADFSECMAYAENLLHLDKNSWCDFAHKKDCSFAGVYQPTLPVQSEHFGEFLAFSNIYDVFAILGLPERASLAQLHDATEYLCSLNTVELNTYKDSVDYTAKENIEEYCFRSAYIFNLLRNGYGFGLDDHITATKVLKGHKVGWTLGAMLYELNTLPWTYTEPAELVGKEPFSVSESHNSSKVDASAMAFIGSVVVFGALLIFMLVTRKRRHRQYYEPIKETLYV